MTLTDKEFEIMKEAHKLFADKAKVQEYQTRAETNTKDMCDKHHSFEELYEHRRKLSAIVFNQFKQFAWKSHAHSDGEIWDGLFIVGVTIPGVGDYSYHYHTQYWDEFDVPVVDRAPEYDGHTPKDIDRLFELERQASQLPIDHPDVIQLLERDGDMSNITITVSKKWFDEMRNGDKKKCDLWNTLIIGRGSSGYPYIIFDDNM